MNQQNKGTRGCCCVFLLIIIIAAAALIIYNIWYKTTKHPEASSSYTTETEESTDSEAKENESEEYYVPDAETSFEDQVRAAFGYGDETLVLDVTNMEPRETMSTIAIVMRSCPERIVLIGAMVGAPQDNKYMYACFWVQTYGYGSTMYKDNIVEVIEPVYTVTDSAEIDAMQAEIDLAAQEILANIPYDKDLWGQCKQLHDNLIRRITYDKSLSHPHIYDIYGALVNGDAVCQGYAYAFSYLMNLLGHDCPTVVSDTHAWNIVNEFVNCREVFLDVTWDDNDTQDSNGYDYIMYDYFGLTKEELQAVDDHTIIGAYGSEEVDVLDVEPFNYHKMYGYVLVEYSFDQVVNVFSQQRYTEGNVCTIKCLTDEAWAGAQELLENDGALLVEAFYTATNCQGQCIYWVNDAFKVINIAAA